MNEKDTTNRQIHDRCSNKIPNSHRVMYLSIFRCVSHIKQLLNEPVVKRQPIPSCAFLAEYCPSR